MNIAWIGCELHTVKKVFDSILVLVLFDLDEIFSQNS